MGERFAGFWIRVFAVMIDAVVFALPMWILDYFIYNAIGPNVPYLDYMLLDEYSEMWTSYDATTMVIWLSMNVIYYCLLTSRFGGTIGKLVLGLRVVNENGQLISFRKAIGRYLAMYLSALFGGFGYLMVAFSKQKQGLHDILCKTYVIRTR